MKKSLAFLCMLLGLFLIGSLNGYHFTSAKAIPGDVIKVRSLAIGEFGQAVLFEDRTNQSFGVAEIEKRYGFLYRYQGGSSGYSIEQGKPFQASGIGDRHAFLVAIKTADHSKIKYIVLGNHIEGITPSDHYELSLQDVKENRAAYHVKEVKDGYALFVLDDYTEDTWTIRAFDKDGKLIADKLLGAEPRYIN
ncbi:hypothetical protein [Neobacillus drentensis]|uniref:hypothetical protein n=1 Tax=Neobacillus drentensis TaxID=220684 RepID=UPI002FFFC30F